MSDALNRILNNPPDWVGATTVADAPLDSILAHPPVILPRETAEEAEKQDKRAHQKAEEENISLDEAYDILFIEDVEKLTKPQGDGESQPASPDTYLGGARAPVPTATERAIGWVGEKIGLPVARYMTALPGGTIATALMETYGGTAVSAFVEASKEAAAQEPRLPEDWALIGGTNIPEIARTLAPYVMAGPFAPVIFAEHAAARAIRERAGPVEVAGRAATGYMGGRIVGKGFRWAAGKIPGTRAEWLRSLTPEQLDRLRAGLLGGFPKPPQAVGRAVSEQIGKATAPVRKWWAQHVTLPREYQALQDLWVRSAGESGGNVQGAFNRMWQHIQRAKTHGTPEQQATADKMMQLQKSLHDYLAGLVRHGKAANLQGAWDWAVRTNFGHKLPALGERGAAPMLPNKKDMQANLESLGVDSLKAAEFVGGIVDNLTKVGGDFFKAAIMVGVPEVVAQRFAEMVGRGIEAAPTGPQAKRELPAPPVPERDLLGQEVRPGEVQRPLWGERGVEAVWQTIEGVSYVLAPDGLYATRSDGTGPLIPKDDIEALRADAREAAPPAPAVTEGRGLPTTPGETEPATQEAPGVGAEAEVAPQAPAGALPEAAEEVVPFEVLAKGAPRVAPTMAIFKDLSAAEVIRHLTKIRGPIGSLAKYKEVGEAVEELRDAMKREKAAEAAEKEYLKTMRSAYPDALAEEEGVSVTPLLDWMKGDKINAWAGLMYATEIEETIAGRPALAKLFVRKQPKVRPPQGYLDQVTDSAVRDPDSGFRGQTVGDFLDQMVAESGKAAARAEGKVSTEEALRRLARAGVPEEAGAELTERADALAAETAAVEAAREKLLEAATPYLTLGGEPEVVVIEQTEAEAKKAAATMARADQALRVAQAAQVAAERGLMTAQEQVKALKAAAKLSGVPHMTKALRAIEKAKTPEDMEAARNSVAFALEQHVKGEHAKRADKTARRIESWAKRGKFDPADTGATALIQTANETNEASLVSQPLERIKARERQLAEGLHHYQTADILEKSKAGAKASELADVMFGEMDGNALGRIDTGGVGHPDVGRLRGLSHLLYKWLTTIEEQFGLDSRAEKLAMEFLLGKEDESTGARAYYRMNLREDSWLNGEIKKATGWDRSNQAEAYLDWATKHLVLDLPDAGRVELTVDEWMALVNTCKDGDGNMQVGLVPIGRAINPNQEPVAERISGADRKAMLKGLDSQDPRILKTAEVYWKWHQNQERFREWSEAWHSVKGWWPEPLDNYYPLHRDAPQGIEEIGTLQAPGREDSVSDQITYAVREIGFMQERAPDARGRLLLLGAEAEYRNHSRAGSALVAYGVPAKNIEKVMNSGSPSLLRRLEAVVGKTPARSVWVDTVRHVLETAGLSRKSGLQGNRTLEQLARQGMGNLGIAYFSANPFTARSQLFGIFGKLSDPSSPISVADFVAGSVETMLNPMKYWNELKKLSPLVENRVSHAPALYMFGDVREAQGRRRVWVLSRWWRRAKTAVVQKLFWARYTDAWTQVARYRINYRYLLRKGFSPEKARVRAARMTEMDIENQDFPAHAGSADMLSQQAQTSTFKRILVFAGQSRSSQANLLIRNFNRFRRDKNVKRFLKSLIGLLLTAVGISSTNVLRTLGKKKKLRDAGNATKEFVAEMFSSVLGNIHGVRQIVGFIRYTYGSDLPLIGTVRDLAQATAALFVAIGEMDEEKAWKASLRMSYSAATLTGFPIAGANSMYQVIKGLMDEELRARARTGRGGKSRKRTGRGE